MFQINYYCTFEKKKLLDRKSVGRHRAYNVCSGLSLKCSQDVNIQNLKSWNDSFLLSTLLKALTQFCFLKSKYKMNSEFVQLQNTRSEIILIN